MVLRIKQIVVLLLLFQLLTFPSTNCIYRTNTEPLQTGLIFSLPYDIANTLRAPLAGPLSLILTAGLALVMFFGILISPITYIFGYPSRNYYIHDAIKDSVWNNWGFDEVQRSLRRNTRKKRSFLVQNSSDFLEFPEFKAKYYESNSNNHAIIRNATLLEGKERIYPKFHESTFSFIPNQDRHCQLLLICHAHGYLTFCPSGFIRFYNFLSKNLIGINEDQKHAIVIGLEDQSECKRVFNKCTNELTTITRTTFKTVMERFMEIKDYNN